MTPAAARLFAPSKVSHYPERMRAYLAGERMYPTTIEMDLTQRCTRSCSGCPYSVSRRAGLTLELPFLERLFSILGPHTPGLVLTGGEATIVPHFAETVALAKEKGFTEIVVISNGANIDVPAVQDALLSDVASIRVSLYDWQEGDSHTFLEQLRKIGDLRKRVEEEGSALRIGASMLTRTEWTGRFEPTALKALDSRIHWLYFHPYCVGWDERLPVQADQTGVLEAIAELTDAAPADADIQVPYERYSAEPLHFEKLHGSHFLLQVGADGVNYAGPESKYEEDMALLDLNEYLEDDFLWHPQRTERLDRISSENYRFVGTRHRPPIFSDHIQRLISGADGEEMLLREASETFSNPSII
jgi:hypothetical protein